MEAVPKRRCERERVSLVGVTATVTRKKGADGVKDGEAHGCWNAKTTSPALLAPLGSTSTVPCLCLVRGCHCGMGSHQVEVKVQIAHGNRVHRDLIHSLPPAQSDA